MIISHKHRFIFFAVPRTATHSLRRALRPHLAVDDWEQQMLNDAQALPVPALAALKHGHISFRQLREHLPAEMLDGYFKFAFVRHPFDRFLSACFFLNRGNPEFPGRETACIKQLIRRAPFRRRILITPQSRLVADEHGRARMDYVGRFETLQDSYNEICRRVGIPPAPLPSENASANDGYASCFDEELRDWAAEFYREDFDLFGYDPRSVSTTAV